MTQLHADILLRARAKIESREDRFLCVAIIKSGDDISRQLSRWVNSLTTSYAGDTKRVTLEFWLANNHGIHANREQMRLYRLRWLDEYLIPESRGWK